MVTASEATKEPAAPVEAPEKRLILSVEQMLSASDEEFAEIPTWKIKDPKTGQLVQGFTRIGSLNADDVIEWRESSDGPAKRTMGIRLFVNSLVDENNNRIGSQKHYEAFKKKSNAIQERVLGEIIKMNGLKQRNETQACPKCGNKFPVQSEGTEEAKNG